MGESESSTALGGEKVQGEVVLDFLSAVLALMLGNFLFLLRLATFSAEDLWSSNS